jgi:hypothetical protein
MSTKKIIGALAIAGGLAGGGAVGAVLGTPGVSSAQSSTSSDSSSSTAPDSPGAPGVPGEGHGPRFEMHGGGVNLETAANALGMSPDDLRTELESGKTIAQVAGEKGVDVQTVIDAIVADASSHLDEAAAAGKITADEAAARKAELPTRIADLVNNGGPKGGPGHH